jgi:lambda repressor-like predicted transcriptional regulator
MNRQQIKAALPRGGQKEIARRSGLGESAVSLWFSESERDSERIEAAALEVLAEAQAKKQQLQAKFEAALRGEKL